MATSSVCKRCARGPSNSATICAVCSGGGRTWSGRSGEGTADENFTRQFKECTNEDLNTSKALAIVWQLARSNLDEATKRATMIHFDTVLGFGLANWSPAVLAVPGEVLALVEQRTAARAEKRFADADALRDQVDALGYIIEDTPDGAVVHAK